MNIFGNLIWLIFGGFFAALGYCIGGIILSVTILGTPWGLQCFKMEGLVLCPFGKEVVSNSKNTGCLSMLFNMVWLLTITIIGIPFARQHFKLIEISMMPFGKTIKPLAADYNCRLPMAA